MLPWITPRFFRRFGNRPSELEAKFLLLTLFGLGALAAWADSEAVLPVMGMVLAGTVGKDHALVRRLRTVTFGLLTPFYFIRAGSFVSVPALIAAPIAFLILLSAKMITKFVGVFPVTRAFKSPMREGLYTTLLMSTGLTFGSISALFGALPWHCHSGPVLAADRCRHRQRRHADADCQRLLPAASSYRSGGRSTRRRSGRSQARTCKDSRPSNRHKGVNHILVAFDGSESASRAFDFGLALAAKFGAAR